MEPRDLARPMDLRRLTSIRAIAALLVFGYHINHHGSWLPGGRLFASGFVGVAFFFILSGFVLTWSTKPGSSARDFWARRFARVYPSHFVMAGVALLVPVTAFPVSWGALTANIFLVQAWFPDWSVVFGINAVSWSLSCEAFFYLIAPFLIGWSRERPYRQVVPAFGAWSLLAFAAAVLAGFSANATDVWAYTNPLIRSGEFVLGILLAIIVQRGWRPNVPVWVGFMVVLGVAVMLRGHLVPQSVVDVLFVLPFALIVWLAASADLRGASGLLTHRWAVYAGEVSFAFYLVHELVIMNLIAAVGGEGGWSGLAWAVMALVLSVMAAVALHHAVELPAQRWLRRRLLRGRQPSGTSPTGSG